jgi:thiol:disulfide interchange protein DsbD
MHKLISKFAYLVSGLICLFGAQNIYAAAPASAEDLLHPEQAFLIAADGSHPNKIMVKWRIAEGYYLYKSKIRFNTDSADITLTTPSFPEAETKNDPFFGEIEIYRDEVVIEIPILKDNNTPDIITLFAKSQGCADIGVCFPPQTQQILVGMSNSADNPMPIDPEQIEDVAISGTGETSTDQEPSEAAESLDFPADEQKPAAADPLAALIQPGNDFGFGAEEDDILTPEQAYILTPSINDKDELVLHWQIADGTYLYFDKFNLSLDDNSGLGLGDFQQPKPEIKSDSVRPDGSIGDVAIYHNELTFTVPLLNNADKAGSTNLTVKYQGCAERGICYPPVAKTIGLSFPAKGQGPVQLADEAATTGNPAASSAVNSSISPATPTTTSNSGGSEEDRISDLIKNSSSAAVIGIFFLIGLGLAFTPCVFPMIPILSGIITGQGKDITTGKAAYLSIVYVLAMALTYTTAGVFAAMSGENLQILLQIPWVIALFAGIFVLLAFSMFGFYELQLPSSLQSKITELSNKQAGGNTAGVAIMGLLSALIVGPCVAPPLAGALLYIGQTNDPVLGGLALFAMSMGMGTPLILIGASAGKLLPHAGAWMDTVKAVFGVSMLALAIYFLERILPETIILLLWGTLFITSAIYMGAINQLPVEASGWQKLWKGLGFVLMIYGVLMMIGAAANSKDVRQPLRDLSLGSGFAGSAGEQIRHFKRITTMAELDTELAQAKAAGKPAVLDFYADWCVYCKTLEKEIFPHPDSQAALANAVLIQADVTDAGSENAKALMKRFGVIAPPVIVFWDSRGNELKNQKIVGNVTLEDFVARAGEVLQ